MQWSHRLAQIKRGEERRRLALQVAETASIENQMVLLTQRGTVAEVQRWLERCTDVDAEKAAQIALDLFEMLRDMSGETYREYERARAERVQRGARR